MGKKIFFTVVVEFEDGIYDDNEVAEVAENIALGLERQVNNEGLAPEASETFTRSIEVAKDGLILAYKTL